MRIPYVKFIGQTTMYFVFLVLIMISTFTEQPSDGKMIAELGYKLVK